VLTGLDRGLYQLLNGLAGRSALFDTLVALPLESNLVKAGVIGACFIFAWHGAGDDAAIKRRRRILIVTALASVMAIATTKLISTSVFLPRPYVLSQKTYLLDDGALTQAPLLPYRVPLNERNGAEHDELKRGEIEQNDLGSFPSDHAGFYVTLAAGIALASRVAGLVAIGWLLAVTLASRVITGQHSPLDLAGGAAIGLAILAALQWLASRWGSRLTEPITGWTIRHPALSASLAFLFVFEATNALDDVRMILDAAKTIAALGGGA
jgi:membrane-associated phospholipid phosphatase